MDQRSCCVDQFWTVSCYGVGPLWTGVSSCTQLQYIKVLLSAGQLLLFLLFFFCFFFTTTDVTSTIFDSCTFTKCTKQDYSFRTQESAPCPPPWALDVKPSLMPSLAPSPWRWRSLEIWRNHWKHTTNHILHIFAPPHPHVDINTSSTDLHMKEFRIVNDHLENTACHRAKKKTNGNVWNQSLLQWLQW